MHYFGNRVLAASILIFLVGGRADLLSGQEKLKEVAAPLLWEIEGETTSYLFGTIHITDERCLTLSPEAKKAFDSSEVLYVETAPKDQLKQLSAITLKDVKLTELLSEEMLKRIDQQLAEINPAISHRTLPPFKIYAWAIVLPSMEAQLKDPNAEILDMKLIRMATEKKSSVFGLEQPETQLSGMDALTKEEQLKFLEVSLKAMETADENDENLEEELAELYLKGDTAALHKYFEDEMNDGEMDEKLVEKVTRALLTDRNERMVETIVGALKESPDKSFFFAAGAAHFVGDESIQALLRKKGFKVKRVERVSTEPVGN